MQTLTQAGGRKGTLVSNLYEKLTRDQLERESRGAALIGRVRSSLSKGNAMRLRVYDDGEMPPFIVRGDLINVEPVSPVELKRSDIAFYQQGERFFCRRVIRRRRMKNDEKFEVVVSANGHASPEVIPGTQVLGRITHNERRGREVDLSDPRKPTFMEKFMDLLGMK